MLAEVDVFGAWDEWRWHELGPVFSYGVLDLRLAGTSKMLFEAFGVDMVCAELLTRSCSAPTQCMVRVIYFGTSVLCFLVENDLHACFGGSNMQLMRIP